MRNENIYKTIKQNFDGLSKPLDSLGKFEEIIAGMGAVLQDESCKIDKAALLVFCSDNGIIEEGVSQSDESVTASIARLLGQGLSSVCHMAKAAGVSVFTYDLGIKLRDAYDGVDSSFFIERGTKNFLKEPAMSLQEENRAIEAGRAIARRRMAEGFNCILLGEMGIGNTTTSAAVIASLLNLKADEICGRGSGLSKEGFNKKCFVIDEAMEKYALKTAPASEVLRIVGGFDIAAMTGTILEAAQVGIPVILDGLITAAAALVAVKLDESAKDVIFFSHRGKEKGIMSVAEFLGQEPVLDADMALGEGTGAVVFYGALTVAKALYDGNTTFEKAKISSYERFEE